ncbi:hypothetical protein FVEG_04350 [Fusarium verticillioides 7600]|uniref:F-box domain-containing protein n=1 Tax=Gibberella moniliformis (strain M3125 / FGSC 7600) TaxID=334819 RepID=W7LVL2_GIBM7|nr:hypothetical protein FVEG_04350 [Fusarium verticillioides 7600]EWG42586.1 hypothetical protein FVEG_04350 [Fusarium verticillioides 7600]
MSLAEVASPSAALQGLPNELLGSICSLLCNLDVKSLRLTCRALRDKSYLRFDRIFISANPRDVDVFLAVANHDIFRHRVKEIIWDDTLLRKIPITDDYGSCGYSEDESDSDASDEDESDDSDACPENEDKEQISRSFVRLCKDSIFLTEGRLKYRDWYQSDNEAHIGSLNEVQNQHDNLMPTRDSLAYYTDLLHQQSELLSSNADEEAFRYAIQRFTQLTKVTITPAAHGFLFMPLYETPMIRAFPSGFVYPIPRAWPRDGILRGCPEDCPEGWENDEERKQWRGLCMVSKALDDYADKVQISELVVDGHKLPTGIDYTLFDKPNAEYNSLCRIVARPGFKRLVLSLTNGYRAMNFPGSEDLGIYRNGRISNLLAKATDLEEVTLQINDELGSWCCDMQDFISLYDIFPVDIFSAGKLRHFGLCGLSVKQDDLISFLGNLPSTLRSVELSFLALVRGHGTHATMLAEVRDKLGWRHRPVNEKGRYVCLDKEVHEYIYGDGPMPFIASERWEVAHFTWGTGIIYDEFDPGFAVPYEDHPMRRERQLVSGSTAV